MTCGPSNLCYHHTGRYLMAHKSGEIRLTGGCSGRSLDGPRDKGLRSNSERNEPNSQSFEQMKAGFVGPFHLGHHTHLQSKRQPLSKNFRGKSGL